MIQNIFFDLSLMQVLYFILIIYIYAVQFIFVVSYHSFHIHCNLRLTWEQTTSEQHFSIFLLYLLSFFGLFSSPLLKCLMHVFYLVIINCGHYLAKHNFLFRASFSCQRSFHIIRLRALSLQRDGGKERGGILFQLNAPSSLHTLHATFDGWKANHFCTNKSPRSQKVETNPWKLLNLTFRC